MKRIVFLFVMLFLVFCLSGCGFSRYSSHYYTIAHGTSYDSDSVSVFFGEFKGTEVFKMKIEKGKTARIQYSGELEAGSLTVYYDCKGDKAELFSLQGGDEANAFSEEFSTGKVYIIVEASENCKNGACDFEIIYD